MPILALILAADLGCATHLASPRPLSVADAQMEALAHAPIVAAARARVSEARAELRLAQGNGGASAVLSYSQTPQAGLQNLSSVEQKLTTVGAQIPISAFLMREPLVIAAQADLRSAQESEADAERRERIKVIGLYIDAQRAQAVRQLREQIENESVEDERIAVAHYRKGTGPHVDVWKTEVLHFQAEDHLEIAIDDEHVALELLALEIGRDAAPVCLQSLPRISPGVPRTEIADALATALAKRPDVAAAEAEVEAKRARMQAAQRSGLPQVTAQLGYAYGVDTQLNVNGPAGVVTLAFPLNDRTKAQAAGAQGRLDVAEADLEQARQTVSSEVAAALATLRSDVFRSDQAGPITASTAAKSVADRFRRGKASGLELFEARQDYVNAAVESITASAALDYAEDTWPLVLGDMAQY